MTSLVIDISKDDTALRMTAYEKGKSGEPTLKHYSEKVISASRISFLCESVLTILNKANKHGLVEGSLSTDLRKTGQRLFDELLSIEVKKKLKSTSSRSLIIYLDESLVQIPWELLFDGEDYLSLKFAIGRSVKTRRKSYDVKYRSASPTLKMLTLADPRGDLDSAYKEGVSLRKEIDRYKDKIHLDLRTTEVNLDYAKSNIRDCDILHYAGHANYNEENPSDSGWSLSDGELTANDIFELGASAPMPSLVFSNACQSGQTGEWKIGKEYENEIFGLANAFLLAGTRHYIGTFWRVIDDSCLIFSNEFYSQLCKGVAVGEAVRMSRLALIQKYGENSIIWASYMLYGEPSSTLATYLIQEKKEPHTPAKKRALSLIIVFSLVAVLAILGVGSAALFYGGMFGSVVLPGITKTSLAVMDFSNANEQKKNDWLSQGITNAISNKLSGSRGIRVIDRGNINNLWLALRADEKSKLDNNTAIKIAKGLGANRIVLGQFQKADDNLQITAKILQTSDGEILEKVVVRGKYSEMFKLQDEVSMAILSKLSQRITNVDKSRIANVTKTNNVGAYELFQKASQAYNDKNYSEAIKLCENAIEIDPNYIDPIGGIGKAHAAMGESDLAMEFYMRAIEQSKKNDDLIRELENRYLVSEIYLQKNYPQKALEELLSTLAIAQNVKDKAKLGYIHHSLSRAYLMLRDLERAEKYLKSCKRIAEEMHDPNLIAANHEVYAAYEAMRAEPDLSASKKHFQHAIEYYEKTANKTGVANVLFQMAIQDNITGHPESAIKNSGKAVVLFRELGNKLGEAHAYRNMAGAYREAAYLSGAGRGKVIEFYKKSLDLYTEMGDWDKKTEVFEDIASSYLAQSDGQNSLKYSSQVIQEARSHNRVDFLFTGLILHGQANVFLGNFNIATSDYEEALGYVDQISVRESYEVITLYRSLGDVYKRQENYDNSEKYYLKGLEIAKTRGTSSTVVNMHANLGNLFEEWGRYEQAVHQYKQAINYAANESFGGTDNHSLAMAYYGLGNALAGLGNTSDADTAYEKSIELATEANSSMLSTIASARHKLKSNQKSKEITINDPELKLLYEKSVRHVIRGQNDEALVGLKEIDRRIPNNSDVLILIAEVYKRDGAMAGAIEILERVSKLALEDDDYESAINQKLKIGMLHSRLGHKDETLAAYESALKISDEANDEKGKALIYADFSQEYQALRQDAKAEEMATKSIELGRLHGMEHLTFNAYRTLALLRINDNRHEEAIKYANLGHDMCVETGCEDLGRAYDILARAYRPVDMLRSAELFNKAIKYFEKQHSTDMVGVTYSELAGIYAKLGQQDKSINFYKKSLEISEKVNNKWTASVASYGLVDIYLSQNRLAEADVYEKKLIRYHEELSNYARLGQIFSILGDAYRNRNKEKSAHYYSQSENILESHATSLINNASVAQTRFSNYIRIAIKHADAKNYIEAKKILKQAIEIAPKITDLELVSRAYIAMGFTVGSLKEFAEAEKYFDKSMEMAVNHNLEDAKKAIGAARKIIKKFKQETVLYESQINKSEGAKHADNLMKQATFYISQRRFDLAKSIVIKALEEYANGEYLFGQIYATGVLVDINLVQGELDQADLYYADLEKMVAESENALYLMLSRIVKGGIFEKHNELGLAMKEYQQGLKIMEADDELKQFEPGIIASLGSVSLKMGNASKAIRHYKDILEMHQRYSQVATNAISNFMLGYAYYTEHEYEKVEEPLKGALLLADKISDPYLSTLSYVFLARNKIALNDTESARSYYESAVTASMNRGDTKLIEIAKRYLKAHDSHADTREIDAEVLNLIIDELDFIYRFLPM